MMRNILGSFKDAVITSFETYHEDTEIFFVAQTLQNPEMTSDQQTSGIRLQQLQSSQPGEDVQANAWKVTTQVTIPKDAFDAIMELLQLCQASVIWHKTQAPKAQALSEMRDRIAEVNNKICDLKEGVKDSTIEEKDRIIDALRRRVKLTTPATKTLNEQEEIVDEASEELFMARDTMIEDIAVRFGIPKCLPDTFSHLEDKLKVKESPISEELLLAIEKEAEEVNQAILDSYKNPWEEDEKEARLELEAMCDRTVELTEEMKLLRSTIASLRSGQHDLKEGEPTLAELETRQSELAEEMMILSEDIGLRGVRVTPDGDFIRPEPDEDDSGSDIELEFVPLAATSDITPPNGHHDAVNLDAEELRSQEDRTTVSNASQEIRGRGMGSSLNGERRSHDVARALSADPLLRHVFVNHEM